jgi:hypothetical protein
MPADATDPDVERFRAHLRECHKEVMTWPEWKRGLLGWNLREAEPVAAHQPPPRPSDAPPSWPAVVADVRAMQCAPSYAAAWDTIAADMEARDRLGRERYGVPLAPGNGRDSLRDAYEEALDLTVYLFNAHRESGDPGEMEAARLRALYRSALGIVFDLRRAIGREATCGREQG